MKVTFSTDLKNDDGDVYDKCLLLHIDDIVILKLPRNGLNDFILQLINIKDELEANYNIKE